MSQSTTHGYPIHDADYRRAKGSATGMVWLLPIGILLAVLSLTLGSTMWASYVLLTGWLGAASGFGASKGWAEYKLGITSEPHPNLPPPVIPPWVWGIFTFWLPSFAVVIVGGMLGQTLKAAGEIEAYSGGMMMQSFSYYFCAAGACWSGLWRATRER